MLHAPLLLLLSCLPPTGDSRLLAAVPEGAFALVRCADPLALQERARQNDWVHLLGSEEGVPIFRELERSLTEWTGTGLDTPLEVGIQLRGESLFFAAPSACGLLSEPPAERAALAQAMRAWLAERAGGIAPKQVELLGGSVWLVPGTPPAAAEEGAAVSLSSAGGRRLSAVLEHPRALGMFAADDEATLLRTLRGALLALDKGEEPSLARAFRAGRGARPEMPLEFFIDFTPFAAEAEARLAEAGRGAGIDPTGLLGLEKGTWLYVGADVQAGERIQLEGQLAIPPDSLTASLADTLVVLPEDLAARLPAGAFGFVGLGWDWMAMVDRARKALDEAGRKTAGQNLDQGLQAAGSMTGVDVEEAFFRQLTGTYALYFMTGAAENMLRGYEIGLQVGIRDPLKFEEALEAAMGIALGGGDMDPVQIEGQDAYVEGDFGLAILSHVCVAALGQGGFKQSLRALGGDVHASLATGTRLQAAIGENSGSSFLACFELSPLRRMVLEGREPPKDEQGVSKRDPFDCQLVASARRFPGGFGLSLYTR